MRKPAQTRLGMILPVKLHKRAMALAWPVGVSEVIRQLLQEWVDNNADKANGLSDQSTGVLKFSNKKGTHGADTRSGLT